MGVVFFFPSCPPSSMSPLQLRSELFVFDTPPLHGLPGLKMTAKRYYTSSSDSQGLTLLFAHGIGARQ
jgi:hypothetical protein